MRILLVEDHDLTARSIHHCLQKHRVTHVSTCSSADQQLRSHRYDAIILDLHVADGSTEYLCSSAADQPHHPAVVIVSGKSDLSTKVRALEAGADDFITKPFTSAELYARVEAVTRRTHRVKALQKSPKFAGLSLEQNRLCYQGREAQLTPNEALLIAQFLRLPKMRLSKLSLASAIHQHAEGSKTKNSLEVHIKNLRRKLGKITSSHTITTIYGLGYQLEDSDV